VKRIKRKPLQTEEHRIISFIKYGVALSLLPILSEYDPVSSERIKNRSFCLGLKATGGPDRRIIVGNGTIELEDHRKTPTQATLLFKNPGEMCNLFSGIKSSIIPVVKNLRFRSMLADFRILMERLQYYLNPDEETLQNISPLSHVSLFIRPCGE